MILGLEIAMLIGGLVALVTGKLKLSQRMVTEGVAARLAGAVFLLPLPMAFTIGMVIGFMQATQGKPMDGSFNWTLVLMEAGIVVGCLVVGLVIAFVGGKAPKDASRRKGRLKRRDEEFDDEEGREPERKSRGIRPARPREPEERDDRIRTRPKSESEDY
jgi:hypothetical protein